MWQAQNAATIILKYLVTSRMEMGIFYVCTHSTRQCAFNTSNE